ncbi:MAG: SGNH/GDSL hydrolase family protein [Pseudomonadota bacterium]
MSNNLDFNQIVYFGDSLTDSGEFFALSELVLSVPFPSTLFGYQGQFSNGDVYSDFAPELLGVGVQNFAVGGARALGEAPAVFLPFGPLGQNFPNPDATPADIQFVSEFDINLGGQVGRFLASLGGQTAEPGTAASIFIGLNDFNAFTPTPGGDILAEFSTLAANVLGSTLGAAGALLQSGVSKVFINTLPPANFFPSFQFADPQIQAIGVAALQQYNESLIATAEQTFGPAVEFVRFDVIGQQVLDDPSAFGFLNVTDPKFFGTGADPTIIDTPEGPVPFFAENPALEGLDEDQFAFVDFLHFSSALHGVFGAFKALSIEDGLTVLSEGNDRQSFGRDDDFVIAGAGNDKLFLRAGDDTVLAGTGNDKVFGGRGEDLISGGSGNDKLFGGRNDDVLGGGEGNDKLFGGRGNDLLIDGLGSDTAFGGSGDDEFVFTEASLIGGVNGQDHDIFIGGRGEDTLFLALTEETRNLVEADLDGGWFEYLGDIGVTAIGIENFVFVDSRLDLADAVSNGRVNEADLFGLV